MTTRISHPPAGSKDAQFRAPTIDVDEWRDEPVRHRYVHGGFDGSDTRFSFYFPPAERYEGRFFHPVLPMSGIEFAATIGVLYGVAGSIEFAVDSGAYLVESNLGRANPFPGEDWSLAGYRASAAVARYGRQLAAEMYGEHRPYGYIYGGSGGSLKTLAGFEGAPDVWDGAVPFVTGIPQSMPNTFSSQALALRVLRHRFPQIVDATEPGGSGDIYAGLTVDERQVLAEVTRLGFPPKSWFDADRLAQGYTGVWAVLADNILKLDPGYFDDFWAVPGYLGHDAPQSLVDARVQHRTTVAEVIFGEQAREMGLPLPMAMPRGTVTELPAAIRLAEPCEGNALGATVELLSGKAAGHAMYLTGTRDDIVIVGMGEAHFEELAAIAPGDEVSIDNSVYLAFQTMHRHQVDPDFEPWQQFTEGGRPIYPQRPRRIGPIMARQGSGVSQSGRFAGKMIVVQTLMDEAAYPWQALWYRKKVRAQLGDRIDDQYRLWFVEHAMHTGGAEPVAGLGSPDLVPSRRTRMVSYLGVLQQALRDVAAWVELGIAPPASTTCTYVDGQVHVPATAAERRGPQAVVLATANGAERADVPAGEPVRFEAHIEVPDGAGGIVGVEWDFEGRGDYPVVEDGLDAALARYTSVVTHTFAEPGTYFPAVRVTNQRSVDSGTPHCRILNLGRVRVVVR
jgi:PKD domain